MREWRTDRAVIAIGIFLAALGVAAVYSATAVAAADSGGSTLTRALPQLLWATLAVVAMFATARVSPRALGALGLLAAPIATAILVIPFLPGLGVDVGGSPRWILLPSPLPAIHPAEFAKPLLVLALAASLSGDREIGAPRSIFRLIRITAIPLAIVIAAPDLGTGSIIAALSIGLYWLAGGSVRSLAAAGALLSAGIAAVLLVTPYQQARIGAWLDPSADPRGASYQILRAREVFAEGGLFGLGPGGGAGLIPRVPNANNDFALAVVGIDWGILGTLSVILAIGALGVVALYVAGRAPSRFEALLAAGAGCWISLQGLLNAGAVLGVLPVTGLPLPLLSAGGSSALAAGLSLGILLGVARRSLTPQTRSTRVSR